MRALAWGLLSFFGFLLIPTLLIWPVGQAQQAFEAPLPPTLGVWILIWVVASGLWARIAARLTLGLQLPVGLWAWVMLAAGSAIAALQAAVLTAWTIARFGYNETEYVGPTAVLFLGVAAVAVAGFGVLIAPRSAVWSPLICVGLGVGLTLAILVENLPGLADGISADSGWLAISTSFSALYALSVGVVSFRRAWHRGTLQP
jgi:hypothetical protein